MKNLYLHIGTNKTGTSAIQKALSTINDLLIENNCIYPLSFRDSEFSTAHHDLAVLLKTKTFTHDSAKILREEIINSSCENTIISSESFHNINDVQLLFPLLSLFENTYIILYVRDSLSYAISWYQQNAQAKGSILQFPDFVYLTKPDLIRVHKDFESIVSDDISLLVREYNRHAFPNGNIIDDFISLLPLDANFISKIPNIVSNASMQNPSICGNLLYLRGLQSTTFRDTSIITNTYNFFTMVSSYRKSRFQGLSYVDIKSMPDLMGKFTRQNNYFNKKYQFNLNIVEPSTEKMSPNFTTLREDFDFINSHIDDSNEHLIKLKPLLSLDFSKYL